MGFIRGDTGNGPQVSWEGISDKDNRKRGCMIWHPGGETYEGDKNNKTHRGSVNVMGGNTGLLGPDSFNWLLASVRLAGELLPVPGINCGNRRAEIQIRADLPLQIVDLNSKWHQKQYPLVMQVLYGGQINEGGWITKIKHSGVTKKSEAQIEIHPSMVWYQMPI